MPLMYPQHQSQLAAELLSWGRTVPTLGKTRSHGLARSPEPGFSNRSRRRGRTAWLCLTACLSQVNVDPEDLIPKLPKPWDLQPFPTTQALVSGRGELGVLPCVPMAVGETR